MAVLKKVVQRTQDAVFTAEQGRCPTWKRFVVNGGRQGITLCTRNWENPNPTARQSLQVTMQASSQHFPIGAGFKPI